MKKVYFGADEETTEVYEDIFSMLMEGILDFETDDKFWGMCRLTNKFTEVCDVIVYYNNEKYSMQVGTYELINIENGEVYDA